MSDLAATFGGRRPDPWILWACAAAAACWLSSLAAIRLGLHTS